MKKTITPGPWSANHCTVTKSDGSKIHISAPRGAAPEAWEKIRVQLESDAKLVAAAPDLLSALEAIANHVKAKDEDYFVNEYYINAMAAIAKAKGEQP